MRRPSRRFADARVAIEREIEEAGDGELPWICAELARLQELARSMLARAGAQKEVASNGGRDRLLPLSEAAERLGVSVEWIRRHQRELPFVRRLSREVLRVSERGLGEWILKGEQDATSS